VTIILIIILFTFVISKPGIGFTLYMRHVRSVRAELNITRGAEPDCEDDDDDPELDLHVNAIGSCEMKISSTIFR
jgi:hypothetical protein